jgi:hypothetical protein
MFGKGLRRDSGPPRVVKMTLDGTIVSELPAPPVDESHPAGPMGVFAPCGSAVDEERFGGDGSIWVADGYGSSLVHRFDEVGRHDLTLDGEEGGGRFDCPHAVFINRRADRAPELYIADRSNRRVQVYDLDGRFLRTFGERFLNSPSGFVKWGEFLIVAELYGRLAVVDDADDFAGYLGADPDNEADSGWPARPGWPNAISAEGRAEPPLSVRPGRFNSPHSIAVDGGGNLFVSEWLLGGRYSKVTRSP